MSGMLCQNGSVRYARRIRVLPRSLCPSTTGFAVVYAVCVSTSSVAMLLLLAGIDVYALLHGRVPGA